MLTDALSKGGLNVPHLEGPLAEELKAQLYPRAAVSNPIDILTTVRPGICASVWIIAKRNWTTSMP